jgi:hypothetical protein
MDDQKDIEAKTAEIQRMLDASAARAEAITAYAAQQPKPASAEEATQQVEMLFAADRAVQSVLMHEASSAQSTPPQVQAVSLPGGGVFVFAFFPATSATIPHLAHSNRTVFGN